MLVSITPSKYVFIFFASVLLAGCAPMDVKDIAADKSGYLVKNFSVPQLPTDVSKLIVAPASTPRKFETIRIKFKYQLENNLGERKNTESGVVLYKNMGNGLIQALREYFNNDIPYSSAYSLSYIGVVPLREQAVHNDRTMANFIVEAKNFKKFDKNIVAIQENSKYEFAWESGRSLQIVNYSERSMHCSSEKFYPAKNLHDAFVGKAIDLNCEVISNGSLEVKQKFAFLEQYGMAILLGFTNTATKATASVVGVEIN